MSRAKLSRAGMESWQADLSSGQLQPSKSLGAQPARHPPEDPYSKELSEDPLSMNPKEIFAILKKTASDWMEHQAPTLGAALAYYTVFSLAPLLIIAIAIAGLFWAKRQRRVRSSTNCGGYWVRRAGKRCRIWSRTRTRSQRPALLRP